ncbi:MAG: acyl-CoA dehydrogenase family protein [Candidatus Obscuribacterales bacterium]|nr:acyl-CoA dehydrogenase family protein [Candidatus Obscuribacterales bacterium]
MASEQIMTTPTTERTVNPQTGKRALYNESQLGWLTKAMSFAEKIPLADKIKSDTENSFRRDLFEAACKEGFGSLPFPKTYGGSGGDYVSFCLLNEEFGRTVVPIMSSLGVHILCQEPVYKFGNEEQKKKYLPPSSTGEYLAAFGLTEPNAGSDTAAIQTTAKLVGDEYILNGTKTFITSGAAADYYIVMAKLIDDKNPDAVKSPKSITAFIVERNFPGFAVGQKFNMLGMRGYATCEIVFNDCRVPKKNLLGEHGQGRQVALGSLAKGRVTIAAQATGWAQGALEGIISHLNSNREKLNEIAYLVGELAMQVESARALTYQAAYAIDRGEGDAVLAGMAKIQATDAAMKVATEAISIVGEEATEPKLLLERIFRDAKAGQIYEGTNQIQRSLIARNLLK